MPPIQKVRRSPKSTQNRFWRSFWPHFGSQNQPKSDFGGHFGSQNRPKIDFGFQNQPKIDFGGHFGSQNRPKIDFGGHFGFILDPKTDPKSIQNQNTCYTVNQKQDPDKRRKDVHTD